MNNVDSWSVLQANYVLKSVVLEVFEITLERLQKLVWNFRQNLWWDVESSMEV